jgi:hypothetical protein
MVRRPGRRETLGRLGGSSPPGLRGSRAPGGGLCSPSPAQHNRFEKIAAKRFAAKLPRHFSRIRGDVGAARCRRWSTPLGTAQSTRSPCAPSGRGGRAPGRWSWLSCRLAGCRHFPPSEPCLVGVCAASLCSGQRLLTRDLLPTRADPTVYSACGPRGALPPRVRTCREKLTSEESAFSHTFGRFNEQRRREDEEGWICGLIILTQG